MITNNEYKEAENRLSIFLKNKLSNYFRLPVFCDELVLQVIINSKYGGCKNVWIDGKEINLKDLHLTLNLEYPKQSTISS